VLSIYEYFFFISFHIFKRHICGAIQDIIINFNLTCIFQYAVFFKFCLAYGNHVQLDQCNFHQCVKLEEFEKSKVMTIIPPTGEVGEILKYYVYPLNFHFYTALSD
jgi:hypothetical protein